MSCVLNLELLHLHLFWCACDLCDLQSVPDDERSDDEKSDDDECMNEDPPSSPAPHIAEENGIF